ncbi:MAG: hypothetical protein GX214_05095 [Clostridiales bacterium]|nr:hypothetical protein [Clostridiales bacterium]
MNLLILRLIIGVIMAYFMGKFVTKMRLPAILGWLLTGMIIGPHAAGIINDNLLNANWYQILLSIFECTMGLMIGTELVLKELKKAGKQIMITTIFQSLATFFVVALFFGVIF